MFISHEACDVIAAENYRRGLSDAGRGVLLLVDDQVRSQGKYSQTVLNGLRESTVKYLEDKGIETWPAPDIDKQLVAIG